MPFFDDDEDGCCDAADDELFGTVLALASSVPLDDPCSLDIPLLELLLLLALPPPWPANVFPLAARSCFVSVVFKNDTEAAVVRLLSLLSLSNSSGERSTPTTSPPVLFRPPTELERGKNFSPLPPLPLPVGVAGPDSVSPSSSSDSSASTSCDFFPRPPKPTLPAKILRRMEGRRPP